MLTKKKSEDAPMTVTKVFTSFTYAVASVLGEQLNLVSCKWFI